METAENAEARVIAEYIVRCFMVFLPALMLALIMATPAAAQVDGAFSQSVGKFDISI